MLFDFLVERLAEIAQRAPADRATGAGILETDVDSDMRRRHGLPAADCARHQDFMGAEGIVIAVQDLIDSDVLPLDRLGRELGEARRGVPGLTRYRYLSHHAET